MLLLTNDDVKQVLTMADCLAVLRRFFAEEASGLVLTRQRTESWLPHNLRETFYQCKTMEGGVPYLVKYVIRIDSNITQEKTSGRPEPDRTPNFRQRQLDGNAAGLFHGNGRAARVDA